MKSMMKESLLNVAVCNAIDPLAAKTINAKNSISVKGELLLYGVIGDWWDGLDAKSIVEQLNALPGNEIVVRIQTPGGSVTEGLAMFNNLKQSTKTVKVFIDGIAASMGSAIAMAGDEINIPSNALFMLHKPSAMVGGNANELRDYADNLDVFEGSLLQIYSDRTGKTVDEIKALLADGKDHYFRGQEAIDYGLADKLTDSVSINASASFFAKLQIPDAYASALFQPTAAAAANPTEENSMKIKIKAKGGGWHFVPAITAALENSFADVAAVIAALAARGVTVTAQHLSGEVEIDTDLLKAVAVAIGIDPKGSQQQPAANPQASSVDAQSAIVAERSRVKELREIGAQASLTEVVVNEWIDSGLSVVDARAKALTAVAQRDKEGAPAGSHIRMNSSVSRPQIITAMSMAVLNRAMPDQFKLDENSGQFRGQSLMGLIATSMQMLGESVVGKSPSDLVAMAMHTTSDFPLILQDAANKVLRKAYDLQPRTFGKIATRTSMSDFKLRRSLQIGGGSSLDKANEHGEFKQGTVSESGESYKLDSFGRIFAFTRQSLINDDLAAFVRFFNQIGNLASRKESDIVYNLIKANAAMSDTYNVFSTQHKNTVAGAAINEATLTGLKKAHRQMVGLDGEVLNIAPAFLVVNSEREVEAQKQLEIIQANQASSVNVFARSMELIVESRLDGVTNNPFYTFSDPNAVPTLEYAYLDGADGPTVTSEWGFNIDGMAIKVVHDFNAGFVDYRGAAKGLGV